MTMRPILDIVDKTQGWLRTASRHLRMKAINCDKEEGIHVII